MKTKLNGNQKNIICGAVVCVLSAVMVWYTRTSIRVNRFITGYGTDSRTVPTIIFSFMFIMGVLLILTSLHRQKSGFTNEKEFKWIPRENLKSMAVVVLMIVAYALLVRYVGFFVMTAIFMLALFLYTKVKPVTAVLITVGVLAALYAIFVVLLKVPVTMNVWLI